MPKNISVNGEEQFNNLNYRFHNKELFERFHGFERFFVEP